jgi:ATP-dependent DNA helicase UvrD/PcrA
VTAQHGAKPTTGTASPFSVGDRVFHIKFGNGNVTAIATATS